MMVQGRVGGVLANWKIDTGAKSTFLTKETYELVVDKPVLQPVDINYVTANGQRLECLGKASMTLIFGDKSFKHEIIVGGVNSNLIGEDFITIYRCVWDHNESCLVIQGSRIPLEASDRKMSSEGYCPRDYPGASWTRGRNKVRIGPTINLCQQNPAQHVNQVTTDTDTSIVPEHLQLVFERGCKHLKGEQVEKFKKFILKNQNCFARPGEVGRTHLWIHKIKLKDEKPVREPLLVGGFQCLKDKQ
ncbi:Hypothetical predicted protein [Mytilus galloprovincialis]|uniref:Peptidase A2 domain-containing protein n=1 Tax=Mytilus galloprovincialis TaxID=29158 RepID=A0A8B6DYH7_MYTGA|nr:Hypothetical predicted protein [Mytilus galloprovincialis]